MTTRIITITVDQTPIDVEEGANLLAACLAHGITIPHLCYLEGLASASASCRLCFVQIAGRSRPTPACTVTVSEPITVDTGTPAVRRLQKAGLQMLLSVHRVDCRRCPANRRCELQRIAKFLKVGLNAGPLERRLKEPEVEAIHPRIDYYPNRCVLCGKCIHACRSRHPQSILTFAKRGFETRIAAYGTPEARGASVEGCRACIDVCPVAALQHRPDEPGL
jgi:NADH dehydrogenase/NADH:ubiquinone oxidoreductase subunit G